MTNRGNDWSQAAAEGRAGRIVSGMGIDAATLGPGAGTFRRFLVEEVIFDPQELDKDRLEDLSRQFALGDCVFLAQMPPNTVIGRLLSEGTSGHERYHYLFPFLPPHLMLPIHAGEHVWAFFEPDKAIDHGFWLCRINEPRHVDDLNHTHADRKYHASEKDVKRTSLEKFNGTDEKSPPSFINGPTHVKDGRAISVQTGASNLDPASDSYEPLITESDSAVVSTMEPVPRYRKRPGDHAIQGSNNTLIVLGTDRRGRTASFNATQRGKRAQRVPTGDREGKAGTIDIVVGRGRTPATSGKTIQNTLKKDETSKRLTDEDVREGDPDFAEDSGRIYLSMDTDVDRNFQVNFSGKVDHGPAGVIKVDHVRIIARKTLKILQQPRADAPESECSGILCKDGNVVFLPASNGLCLIGGEDADKAILTSGVPAAGAGGQVTAAPVSDTLGAQIGLGGPNGSWSTKTLIK